MAKDEIKTTATSASVDEFIAAVAAPTRRADAAALRAMFERATGERATMWGPSIIGFGTYHYRYGSGREGDMCRVGYSPRAANLVLYVGNFEGLEGLLARLGKHKRSKASIYVNRLADIDLAVLEAIIRGAFDATSADSVEAGPT